MRSRSCFAQIAVSIAIGSLVAGCATHVKDTAQLTPIPSLRPSSIPPSPDDVGLFLYELKVLDDWRDQKKISPEQCATMRRALVEKYGTDIRFSTLGADPRDFAAYLTLPAEPANQAPGPRRTAGTPAEEQPARQP